MGIFFNKNKEPKIDKTKLKRDSLLEILKYLQNSNIIMKDISTLPEYKKNKKLIDNVNDGNWDKFDGSSIYPRNTISEFIKILEQVEDGNVEEINKLISKNKGFIQNLFCSKYSLNGDFTIGFIVSYTDNEKTEDLWEGIYKAISDELEKSYKILKEKFKDSVVKISEDPAGSYYQIYLEL